MDEMADTIRNVLDDQYEVDIQVEPRRVFNATPPTIDIYPGDPFLDSQTTGFGEEDNPVFTVRARVATGDSDAGQELLLELMDDEGDLSIVLALEDDRTLNGMASDVYAQGQAGWTMFDDGFGPLLGYAWRVLVIKARS